MIGFEQAQQVSLSNEWRLVKKELDFRIEACLSRLKTCTPNELPEVQQRLQLLEEVKRLPEDCMERENES